MVMTTETIIQEVDQPEEQMETATAETTTIIKQVEFISVK